MRLHGQAREKPGILVITPWLAGGGIERNIEIVAPWFARKGHRIRVLSWDIQEEISGVVNPVLETLKRAGIPVQRLPAFGALRLIQRAAQVAAIALKGRFSIVVGYELEGNLVAIMAKLLLAGRLRAIAEVHNSSESYEAFNLSDATRRLARALYPRADGIIAVSEAIRQDAVRFFRLDPSRVTTIYNPVPIEAIRSQASAPPKNTLDIDGPFIVGCGRLVEMKGFPDLIKAFSMVKTQSELKLLILGTGRDRDALLKCAAEHGVSERVLLPGYRANPHQYIARAKAFVLSSRFGEAFSLVLVEAMVCGTPVIASRCHWGPEEILEDGKYGLLYDVGDVNALAVCLSQALDRPEETARRAEMASDRTEDFSERNILPQLERYFLDT